MAERKKDRLIFKLFAAMAVGVVLGLVAPDWLIRATNCFRDTFGQFVKFIVPFIILGLVTPAIADTGKSAGRLLLLTLGIAYASTLCAGYFAYWFSSGVFPHLISGSLNEIAATRSFPAFFSLKIPPVMSVTGALVTSFVLGLGMIAVRSELLFKASLEFRDIVSHAIAKACVPFLPIYILTVLADLTASGKLAVVGGASVKIMAMAMAATVFVLLVQFTIAGAVAGRNPLKALWTMMPAYLTGWGCCSSAATIPYTLRQTKANGVSDDTAELVVPLCSNVHLAGSMTNMVVYAAGLMVLAGDTLTIGAFTEYIFMISVIAVAAPGVPGGVILACSSIAEAALGFSPERYALMVALYMALDGMGTACNLTGDGALALIIDKLRKKELQRE